MKLLHLGNRRLLDTLDRAINSCVVLIGLLLIVPLATMGAADLPSASPAATDDLWKSNPEAAMRALAKQLQDLQNSVSSTGNWLKWLGGGALLVLGIARAFPGPAGMVANAAWAILAPRITKEQEEKRDVMANGFIEVAAIMRAFPADSKLGDVLTKLNDKLPESVKQAYRDWEKSEAEKRPPTKGEIIETERLKQLAAAPTG